MAAGSFDQYEMSPDAGRLFFYFTYLPANKKTTFNLTLTRKFTGTCITQLSQAYLYYDESVRVIVY